MRSKDAAIHAITVRLPAELSRAAKRLAARRRVSLNELVRIALRRMAEEDRLALSRRSHDALGSNAESDAEPYVDAQREVVRRG